MQIGYGFLILCPFIFEDKCHFSSICSSWYGCYNRNMIHGFSFGVLTDAIQLGLLMESPTSPLVACTAQRHFWIQTSACSGPVEHAQQYAKVRWVPRVPLNRTSSSALSSHAQHKMLQYNTKLFKTQCTE